MVDFPLILATDVVFNGDLRWEEMYAVLFVELLNNEECGGLLELHLHFEFEDGLGEIGGKIGEG